MISDREALDYEPLNHSQSDCRAHRFVMVPRERNGWWRIDVYEHCVRSGHRKRCNRHLHDHRLFDTFDLVDAYIRDEIAQTNVRIADSLRLISTSSYARFRRRPTT